MSIAAAPTTTPATMRRWDRRDKTGLAGIIAFVVLLNVVGWGVLVFAVAPQDYALGGTEVFGVGLGVTAFLLGVRRLMNLQSVLGIVKVFRGMRTGELDEAALEHHLHNRGFLARLLGGATKRVTKPWHVYPVGLLMGLGFDTASQVALLLLAAGTAAFVLPWYAVLVLPVLFAAGMTLFDTADGVFMSRAYGWAFLRPVRKVYYNLTITVLSVIVALVVGVIVLVALLVDQLDITTGPLAAIGSLELDYVGYVVVGMFLLTWAIAVAVWKLGRIEERYSTPVPGA